MKQSPSFPGLQEGLVERKKQRQQTPRPLTETQHEPADPELMSLQDYWASFRSTIQEHVQPERTPETAERVAQLKELISPEMMRQYKEIMAVITKKTKITEDHPAREAIDIEDEKLNELISHWVEQVVADINQSKAVQLTEEEIEDLRGQCWLFFESVSCVMNTRSMERDIKEYYGTMEKEVKDEETIAREKFTLAVQLSEQYSIDPVEAGILVDIVHEKDANKEYSMKLLVETVSRLWQNYDVGEHKGHITKIALGSFVSQLATSFAPSLFQNVISQDRFSAEVFLEYMGLNNLAEIIKGKVQIEFKKVMKEISSKINTRMSESLFFQEFEFIHEKSLGEMYSALQEGKEATVDLLQDVLVHFVPTLSGITMSLTFLIQINPIMGAISLSSMPVMYAITKKRNKTIWPIRAAQQRAQEQVSTNIGTIKGAFEEVKTSPEIPAVAGFMKQQMDAQDELSLKRTIEEVKTSLTGMIPFEVSQAVSAGVGGALQQMGMIGGGAVLSNIIYADRLNRPVASLVSMYFSEFSWQIQRIQRMEEILGSYEKLDLPEGEKEASRIPVSELPNFDISIKGLRYKNILKGIDLDVKQGEFVSIAGESGAGKSTLLRNLVGLYRPSQGSVSIGGNNIQEVKKYGVESIYSMMSYCNQSPQLFSGMTFRENLLLWSKKPVSDERIQQVLKDLHLESFSGRLDEEIKHASGGEKVRIGLARTLIKGAKIMLLDEPTASLDSRAATEVRAILKELHEKYPETTIICVSHDEKLLNTSDRLVTMDELQSR